MYRCKRSSAFFLPLHPRRAHPKLPRRIKHLPLVPLLQQHLQTPLCDLRQRIPRRQSDAVRFTLLQRALLQPDVRCRKGSSFPRCRAGEGAQSEGGERVGPEEVGQVALVERTVERRRGGEGRVDRDGDDLDLGLDLVVDRELRSRRTEETALGGDILQD
jgi:hypothetical protein